jgi:PIN domain nuclease of toxin-antitoxin system
MIVVDTHIIIWHALRPEMLSKRAKDAIDTANNTDGMIFCDISLWEIAMLINKKRLILDVDYLKFIELVFDSNQYILRGISPEIADLSASLFLEDNKDPADRIIAATAMVEKTRLITADSKLQQSKNIITVW